MGDSRMHTEFLCENLKQRDRWKNLDLRRRYNIKIYLTEIWWVTVGRIYRIWLRIGTSNRLLSTRQEPLPSIKWGVIPLAEEMSPWEAKRWKSYFLHLENLHSFASQRHIISDLGKYAVLWGVYSQTYHFTRSQTLGLCYGISIHVPFLERLTLLCLWNEQLARVKRNIILLLLVLCWPCKLELMVNPY